MAEQQSTRTIRFRVVHHDAAPADLSTALARHRPAPLPPPVTIAEQVAQEQAQK